MLISHGTWMLWLWLWSNLCCCMMGSLVLASCWVLWLWLKVKNVIFRSFFIMFASYSATNLMFGGLICLHVHFCGTWMLWLCLWSNLCCCMHGFFGPGCMLGSLALAQGKKMSSLGLFAIIFASYSATNLMFGVLICLHVDFCGTWMMLALALI